MKSCGVGIRVHSGWGALVAVFYESGALEVIDRRRIEIIDRDAPGAAQPYHFARELELDAAGKFIADSAAAAANRALCAMQEIRDELGRRQYEVVAAAVLLSSGRPLPDLEGILASHPLIHTAEGEFFRRAFREACARLKIPVAGVRERDLDQEAKTALGKDAALLKKSIAGMGKVLGPPWTTDEKTAALAAAIGLAGR